MSLRLRAACRFLAGCLVVACGSEAGTALRDSAGSTSDSRGATDGGTGGDGNAQADGGGNDAGAPSLETPLSLAWVKTFSSVGTDGVAAAFADNEDVWLQTEVGAPTVFGAGEPNETTVDADTTSVVHVWMKGSGALDRAERSSKRVGGAINGGTSVGPVAQLSNRDRLIVAGLVGEREFASGQANAIKISAPAAPPGSNLTSARWATIGRYDARGTLAWMQTVGGKTVLPSGIQAFEDSSFVLAGQFAESIDFGSGVSYSAPAGEVSPFIARYASDGSIGWARRVNGNATIYGMASRADTQATFVVGTFAGSVTFAPGESNVTMITSQAKTKLALSGFVASYAANGNLAWVKTLGDDIVTHGVARVADGVVIAGNFAGTTKIAGVSQTASGERDAFVMKLDDSGALAWIRQIRGASDEVVGTLSVDPQGRIWTIGWTDSASLDVAGSTTATGGPNAAYALALDDAGNVWRLESLATNVISAAGVAFHPSGAITVTGQAGPGMRIGAVNLTVQGAADTFIARFVP